MSRQPSQWMAVCLILTLVLGGMIGGANAALARSDALAGVDDSLRLSADTPDEQRDKLVNVALELAGAPVVQTYIEHKARGSAKADAASAQKARKASLEKSQQPVVAALKARLPQAHVLSQHQTLVNAVVVRVKRGDVDTLRTIPGVVHLHEVGDFQRDLSESVPYINAERVRVELGITGRGVRVGILDSGIDYTHRNYGGPGTLEAYAAALTDLRAVTETVTILNPTTGISVTTTMFPTEKIPAGYDFVGDTWPDNPEGILEPDDDPLDAIGGPFTGGHGSHVSGITSGFGVPNQSFNGSIPPDETFDGTTIYHGVAPAAQLYAYKVCSSVSTACSGDAMISGFERATDPDQDGDLSDHLDVVNMSIGATFGRNQFTAQAANNAAAAGVAVALSAGNSADVPYIGGAPALADRVLSVASVFAPGQFINQGRIDAPASLAGQQFYALQQSWAQPLAVSGPISGEVVYIGRACPANTVPGQPAEDPLLADPRGKIALIPQTTGHCAHAARAQRAAQAGAIAAIIYASTSGDNPPSFGSGGFSSPIPTVTVSNAVGLLLRDTAGARVTLSADNPFPLAGFISGFSSRGPALTTSNLKPDVSAPGSNIVSTGAGEGTGPETISGTSMAAPHVAGVMALVKEANPAWTGQEISAAIANTASPVVQDLVGAAGQRAVSVSRQGAGLVDALRAVTTQTVAYVPEQVGSVSFGFRAVVDTATETKTFILSNKGTTPRTYNLAFAFQFPDLAPAGTTVTVSPNTVTLGPGETLPIAVTLTIAAAGLPPYGLTNAAAADPSGLSRSEIGGFVRVTEAGGAGDQIAVPIYTLARRASAIDASANALSLTGFGAEDAGRLRLTNTSAYSGTAEVFALVGTDGDEAALQNFWDIQFVGVRIGQGTRSGATEWTIEFGIKTHGPRTLSLETQFQAMVDANRDGTPDYRVFNSDISGTATGINRTYVRNLATNQLRGPFYDTDFTVNSSNVIIRVPLAEIGLTDDNQAFDFYTLAFPYSSALGPADRAPDTGAFTYNGRDVRFRLAATGATPSPLGNSVVVPPRSAVDVNVYANARGFLGGNIPERFPEQGVLFLYTENVPPMRDADIITLSFPFNFRVDQQTLNFDPSLSGYIVNRLGGLDVQFGAGDMWTGVDNRSLRPLVFYGITHFNLGAVGSSIEFEEAVLELTGLDDRYMDPRLRGRWGVDMLTSAIDPMLGQAGYNAIANAPTDARLAPILSDDDLAVGRTHQFTFDPAARSRLEQHVRTSGRVTFRTWEEPLYSQGIQLFAWDGRGGGRDIRPPVLRLLSVTRLP